MSSPESVSSRMASFGSSTAIWKISLRFFSPPEKPSLTGALQQVLVICTSFIFSRTSLQELHRVQLRLAAVLADGVERRLEEVACC